MSLLGDEKAVAPFTKVFEGNRNRRKRRGAKERELGMGTEEGPRR